MALAFSVKASAQGNFEQIYNDFKKQAQTEYDDFRKKANQEYAEWMKQAWEWYSAIEPVPFPKDNMKPPVIYNKEKDKTKPEPTPVPYEEVEPAPEPEPQPKPVAPIPENDGDYQTASFMFYGTTGEVRLPKGFAFRINGRDEAAYSAAWQELSTSKYDNLIRDCLVLRMKYQLCDWAYLLMLGELSNTTCGKGTNEAVMLQAYIFCQSGYKIRLGFTKSRDLRLLVKSDHDIYNMGGFQMKDGKYYALQPVDGNGLNIKDISYPEEKPLSLWINQEQLFANAKTSERTLTPEGGKAKIKVQNNENLIKFYNSYPTSMVGGDFMTRWAMYANTPLSNNVKSVLYPQLKSIINKAANKVVAADWLLYWVQTAFVYEYDDKVWGHDRAFFAEESLYYPYCDCEDRSILYSRLVRDLLGLDVLLVYYPGHLATAVNFNTAVNGDYINLNGKHFTICDPTYIGAPVGATMPDMDNKTAKVIRLSK